MKKIIPINNINSNQSILNKINNIINIKSYDKIKINEFECIHLEYLLNQYNIDNILLYYHNQKQDIDSINIDDYIKKGFFNIIILNGFLIFADNEITINQIKSTHNLKNKTNDDNKTKNLYLSQLLNLGIISINIKMNLNKNIFISFIQNKKNTFTNYELNINVNENIKSEIYYNFYNIKNINSAINIYTYIQLQKNSHLIFDHIDNNVNHSQIILINNIYCDIYENSSFKSFNLSSYLILNKKNYFINLKKKNSCSYISGISLIKHHVLHDYEIKNIHYASNSKSYINFNIITNNINLQYNIKCKSIIKKHIIHAEAYQKINNINLKNTKCINIKPELEVYSSDVICSHGATIGYLDESMIFYLQSRGIKNSKIILLHIFIKQILLLLKRNKKMIKFYKIISYRLLKLLF